jgi:hypothetical protein
MYSSAGILSPSASAVLRLMVRWKRVGLGYTATIPSARALCVSSCGQFQFHGDELAIEFESKAVDPKNSWLRLHYAIADHAIDDKFQLVASRPHFGGPRWWFLCPNTNRRLRKLYLPPGGHRFRSRTAQELIYTSQQEDFPDRAARRARKIRRKLGGDPMAIRYPRKPPRMPRATYDQLLDKLAAAECIVENAANGRLFAGLARIESLTVDQLFDKLAAAGT